MAFWAFDKSKLFTAGGGIVLKKRQCLIATQEKLGI